MKKIIFIFSIIFGINLANAQSNDCSTATVITPGATCVNTAGTTSGATQSIPGCVGTADDDVWYQFTASATAHQITVTASAGFDPVVQLFSGACSALSTISCMDNGLTGESETIFATGLTVSQVYRIRVYHYYAGAPTTPTFSICVTNPPPVPSNNECAGATLLSVNTSCSATAGTSVGSSQSMAGCAGTADDDVWYRFVATNAVQTITVDPSVNMDPVLELFSGTCGSLTSISCMDVGFTDGNEVISAVGLTPGQTYYIRVYDYYSSTGGAAFNICVVGAATAAPINDEPCNAINLPAVTTTCNYLTFSSLGATTTATPGAPSSCSGGSAPQQGGYADGPRDVWFAITVPSTGNITVTIKPGLASPMNDMVFVLYSGSCGSLTQITCSDDYNYPGAANDLQPFINRTGLTPGSTVYLRVFRYGNPSQYGGDFGLCVSTNTNDACANALYICDLNGYSASTSAAFTADRPGTGTGQMHGNNETAAGVDLADGTNADGPFGYFPYPGTSPGPYSSPALDVNIENNSWIRFTAGATTATLNVSVTQCFVGNYDDGGIQMQIFSASGCNNFVPVSEFKENSTGFTITASGLTIGSDYYLMVDGYANDVCNYTISANSGVLFPDIIASANPICSGASTLLTAPSGAIAYEWQPGGVTTQTLTVSPSTTTTYTCFVSGVCGQRQTLTKIITVNQLPSMTSSTAPAAICSGQTVGLALTSDIPSTYSWVAASNTDVTGETTTPTTSVTITNTLTVTSLTNENVIYTITPTSNAANGSCAGPAQTVTVTVKPRPTLTDPSDQTVCAGTAVAATNFISNIAGTTVNWTRAGSTLTGISASGSTDIATYTAPTVSSQQISTITATVTLNGCAGLTPQSFVITVNPTPQFSSTMSNPSYCGGSASTTISFPAYSPSSGGSIGWTNSNTTAGVNGVGIMLASGTGNITSYAPPMVTATQTASISITPSIGSCSGTPQTVTLTVNPTPVLSAVASPTVCGGNNTSVSFSTSPTATVNWTNSNSNSGITGIGLTAPIGAGDITSFPTPLVAATQTAVINATPLLGSCTGSARQFTITVNPTPVIAAVPSPTVCANTGIASVSFSSAPATAVTWTSSSTSTGLTDPSGTLTVSSFTTTNVTSVTTSTISLNTSLNSCPAAQVQYTITVNPAPQYTGTPVVDLSQCGLSDGGLEIDPAEIIGTGVIHYSWTNSTPASVGTDSPSLINQPAGSYNVTITDDFMCPRTLGPYSITNPGAPAIPTATALDDDLCVGEALSLTSTSLETAPTYAWSGPNSSSGTSALNIGSVTLADAGTYTVTITVSNCTSTNTVSVNVYSNPTPSASSSSAVYCSGSTIDLFGSGGTGFSWSGPDSYTSTNQNPQLTPSTPLMSGTYTLTVTDANGCDAITTTALTVSQTPPLPSVNALPLNLCVGNDINLTATSTGATDYAWTGPNSYSSALQNPTITNSTVLETGTYTVVATASNCPSQPATVNVTINSNPVVTTGVTGSPVCSGTTVTLSADGGTSYAWTGPNTFTSGNQNPQLTNATVQMSGTYSVVVTDANNCSANGTVDLVVDQTPDLPVITVSASSLCEGEDLQLDAVSTGALNYSWLGPNGFTSTISNPLITSVTLTEGGTYTVTATATNCSSPSEIITITVNPTPVATATVSVSTVCSGNSVDLTSTGGTTFSWAGPNGYSSTQADNTITNIDAAATGTYTFTAINPGNCTDVVTFSLTVNQTPSLPIITASASTLCEGENLQLDAASLGATDYVWTGPNGFTSPISNPLITGITTSVGGTYTVTASTPDCVSPSETVSIVVNATPVAAAFISSAIVCSGNTINLTSTGGSTFSWTGPNGYTSTQADNTLTNVDVLATGTYTFTATNTGNCTDQATVSLVVNETPGLPVITASANTLCEGDDLQLSASSTGTGTINYAWSGPNGFNSPISNPLITGVTTLVAGTYTVTASTPDCVSPSETVSIVVNATPVATAAISSAIICSGNTINLTSTGGTTFSWSGPNGYTSTQANNTLTNVDVNAAGTYTFTAINSGNCTDVATVTLTVTQTPAAAVTTGDSTCIGNPITLTALGSGTINWYDDAALTNLVGTGSTLNPNLAANTAGIYYVTVSNGGCTSTTSTVAASNFNINASFTASVLAGSAPLPVTFTNTSTGVDANDTYSWLISDSQFATTYNSAYNFTQGGSFNVDLIITDSPSGCKDTASVTVFVDDEIRIVIPNVFTPNGDGTNDGFVIEIKGGKDAEGTIFNRWGQVLHKWDALNVTWDGKVPNGEAVSDGIYFYIIKVTGYNGKILDVPGNVTIVR